MDQPFLSIIICCKNEEKLIEDSVKSCWEDGASSNVEVIVVDGDSSDNSRKVAVQAGATKVLLTLPNRAQQFNLGSFEARGKWLLFMHADSAVPPNYLSQLQHATQAHPEATWGTFKSVNINGNLPGTSIVSMGVQLRTQLASLPYGDQGLFILSSKFKQIGRYSNLEFMEDVDIVSRLRKESKPFVLQCMIDTSGKRWEKLGVLLTTIINQIVIILFFLGLSTGLLKNLYYGVSEKYGKKQVESSKGSKNESSTGPKAE